MDYSYIFNNHELIIEKLLNYGFKQIEDCYVLKVDLNNQGFYAICTLSKQSLRVKVYDKSFGDEYLPFKINGSGGFVAGIKEEVNNLIDDLVLNCFRNNNIKDKLFAYVKNKYQTIPEYPWLKKNNHATLKTKQNNKWYGIILTIPYTSLGIDKEGMVDVINLKNKPEIIENLIDHQTYFPAYHMNKKYWLSVVLNGSLDVEVIYQLIDESYQLVAGH